MKPLLFLLKSEQLEIQRAQVYTGSGLYHSISPAIIQFLCKKYVLGSTANGKAIGEPVESRFSP